MHRVPGGKRQAVYAYRSEIDAWLGNGAGHNQSGRIAESPSQNGDKGVFALGTEPEIGLVSGPPDGIKAGENGVGPPACPDALTGRQVHRVKGWLALSFGIIALAAAALAFLLSRSLPEPKILRTFQVTNDGRMKYNLATDGARVYFSEDIAGRPVLGQVSTTGGETVLIPTPFDNSILTDVSPERSELMVVGVSGAASGPLHGPLYALPLVGGSPRRLGDLEGYDSSASWSPDGQRMAFANDRHLFLARADGTQPYKLADLQGDPFLVRWSPDGKRLRFFIHGAPNNSNAIWEVSTDGSNLHPVLAGWNDPPNETNGNWTPDSRYFLFGSEREGVNNLWALREGTPFFEQTRRKPVRLTTGPMQLFNPILSPKGNRIFALGTKPRGEVLKWDALTRQFAPYLGGISAIGLDFSRDGRWVAYSSYPEGNLWRSRTDGSQKQQLTWAPMKAAMPRWSPDGRRIAFVDDTPGKPLKAYTVSTHGGNSQEVVPEENLQCGLSWSPDGKSLLFGRGAGPEGKQAAVELGIVDLQTHHVSSLQGSGGLCDARWSPDGRYIAALREVPANDVGIGLTRRLVFYNVAQQKSADVSVDLNASFPNWSADSKYLYFDAMRFTADAAFYRVRISDRKLERLAEQNEIRLVSDGFKIMDNWTGVAPDGSPLITRQVDADEIYAFDVQWP